LLGKDASVKGKRTLISYPPPHIRTGEKLTKIKKPLSEGCGGGRRAIKGKYGKECPS